MIVRMFKDALGCPRGFWAAYGLMLLFVLLIALSVAHGGWVTIPVVLVGVWGIFSGCMAAYQVGQNVAYRHAKQMVEEAKEEIAKGQAELLASLRQLEGLECLHLVEPVSGDIQGPS